MIIDTIMPKNIGLSALHLCNKSHNFTLFNNLPNEIFHVILLRNLHLVIFIDLSGAHQSGSVGHIFHLSAASFRIRLLSRMRIGTIGLIFSPSEHCRIGTIAHSGNSGNRDYHSPHHRSHSPSYATVFFTPHSYFIRRSYAKRHAIIAHA